MGRQIIDTSQAPDIIIDPIRGSLVVKGWEDPQVRVDASESELSLFEKDDIINIGCQGDCEIRVPYSASIKIGTVDGDATIKLIEDELVIGVIHGSLSIRNVADVQIDTIKGDLAARSVSGDFRVRQVNGSVAARQLQGAFYLENCSGDLSLKEIDGEIQTNINGSAQVRLNLITGQNNFIHASGDVQCTIPEDTDLKLDFYSRGNLIKIRTQADSRTIHKADLQTTLGSGLMNLSINSGGAIYLDTHEMDWSEMEGSAGEPGGNINQQIARQVEAQIDLQMAEMTRRINEQMVQITEKLGQAGISAEETERIVAEAMRTSETEAARAQEKMRRAQEKLERKLEANKRRADYKAHIADKRTHRRTWGFDWPTTPKPRLAQSPARPRAPIEAVSEEERIMILRMLQQKKITVEEAEVLLSTLEGKE